MLADPAGFDPGDFKKYSKKKSLLGKFLGDPSHGDPLSAEKTCTLFFSQNLTIFGKM